MQWTAKKRPELNDVRVKKKFLLFPKCLDGVWKWLEVAKVIQRYSEYARLDVSTAIPVAVGEWVDIHWQEYAPKFTYKKPCRAETTDIHPCDVNVECTKNCELYK